LRNKIKLFGAVINRAVINKRISLLLCFLAGMLGAIPYYFEELFIFTFISLFVQLYIVIEQKKAFNRTFTTFFWYFLGFYMPLYLFLSELYPYSRFGFDENQAVFILICSCIAIPLLHALVEATLMLLTRFFRNDSYDIIAYASIWVIGEWLLSLGTLAFPWGGIAISLTGFLPFIQTVSLFGKYFITFITVASCYAFALAITERKRIIALIGVFIISFNTILGTILWYIPTDKVDELKVAAIQGNVLSNEKWESSYSKTIFERYMSMTEDAAKDGAKLIVLPETAIPQYFYPNGKVHEALSNIATEYNVTILSGVHYYDKATKSGYNSVIAVYPDGSLSEHYDKRHLVPFGEFIPFADFMAKFLPFVGEFDSGTSELTEGTEAIVIETNCGTISPSVCFDSIFPQFAREGVLNGSELIAVVTNDSWFNDSNGIYTHLRHAQLRAIENRRYVLRAANTGISAFIDERGKIIEETPPLTVDIIINTVYSIDSLTLYTRTGDIILYISFVLVLLFIIDYIRRLKNGKNTTSSK